MKYLILFFAFIFICISLVIANPHGANVTNIANSTATPNSPTSVSAVAGNVTEINIYGVSTTQTWQGYFGNVSGVITLGDGSRNTLYNWSVANARGEVYASTSNSVSWQYVQCFNYTATGTFASDLANSGSTSLFGLNLSQLESQYNISNYDVDGVNETFIYNDHSLFYTGFLKFDSGECKNAKLFNNTGAGVFEEVLLYEPLGRSLIFTSILSDNVRGFDGRTHDFEMMVLEDGHGTNNLPVSYYFYVELQ